MQLVLINNRVIAHGGNYFVMGSVVIDNETGAKFENATVAECEYYPSDIDSVGYEYHAGVFVPCAPYGKGNNNGYFMEVCTGCATPKNSGIPIKHGIKKENLHPSVLPSVLWKNASINSNFAPQTVTLSSAEYDFLLIEWKEENLYDSINARHVTIIPLSGGLMSGNKTVVNGDIKCISSVVIGRYVEPDGDKVKFSAPYFTGSGNATENYYCVPIKIYGVRI